MFGLSMVAMAWIIGVCLAAYLGVIVYALMAPKKQPDPQRGVAVGCLMFAAIPGIVLAVLLAVGVIGGYETLVRVLFYITVLPALYVIALLIAQLFIKRRQNRNAWESTPKEDTPPSHDSSSSEST